MTYRADIDGLRAVAVLSVLLYHAGVPGFSGGFVGVDVFFVISGYLICGMIAGALQTGTFSLGDFYKRRILRIIPALAVMMLATAVVAYFHFLPIELTDYAYSFLTAAASVSNVYFAATANYFDAPALTKPLLHTWSLGVEEQFYVATPLVMLIVARFAPRYLRAVLILAALGSFALSAFAAGYSPIKAFYYAPSRAWQFLLGALFAVGALSLPGSARLRDGAGIVGLALIFATILFGSEKTPFLLVTGLATLGSVLVIASSTHASRSLAGRLLALPPVVFVGLISYSVYLWHWPLIVYLRPGALLPDTLSQGAFQAIVIALSLGFGVLSWRFVERPFRRATPRAPRRTVFAGFAGATLVLAAMAAIVVKLDGLPQRFSPEVLRLASYLDYDRTAAFRQGQCYLIGRRDVLDEKACLQLAEDRPNHLLVGDSFAAHLWHGLSSTMPEVNVMQASVGQCRPLTSPMQFDQPPCPMLRNEILGAFLDRAGARIDRVLLAASWKDEDIPALMTTLDALKARGLKVVVFGPLVEYQQPLPRILADAILKGDPSRASRLRDPTIPGRDRAMKALVEAKGVEYVSLQAAACPGGVCLETTSDGNPLQFDTGHLTAEASVLIARRLALGGALTN